MAGFRLLVSSVPWRLALFARSLQVALSLQPIQARSNTDPIKALTRTLQPFARLRHHCLWRDSGMRR